MERKRSFKVFFVCLPPQTKIWDEINEKIFESLQANGKIHKKQEFKSVPHSPPKSHEQIEKSIERPRCFH